MPSEYTPTTNRVRTVYEEFASLRGTKKYADEVFAEFDRWLAQHDVEVAADALDRAEDYIIGEDDHEWARNAHGSSISYPTVMEALDDTRDDLGISYKPKETL